MNPVITQGAWRVIRARDIVDKAKAPLTVTNWTVRAVARCHHAEGTLLCEWATTPTGDQGVATAVGREVTLTITPAMSSAWDCDRIHIQAEITHPTDATQVERIISQTYDLDREAVR